MMNREQIQRDFAILNRKINGHALTYLDSSNTSLTPQPVLEAIQEYYNEHNANIHRGIYPLSEEATKMHEEARQTVADFINAPSAREVVFTRNATESINLIAHTWGKSNLSQGDTIVLSMMEHHSNIVPWQLLQKELGFTIHYLNLTGDGRIDLTELEEVLETQSVKLVSLVHESNALGTINPVKTIAEMTKKNNAFTLIDASQSAAHMKIDIQEIGADFLVFTGHKMCGPTGIGVLHASENLLETMPPFLGGGEMIRTVTCTESTWNDVPYKFEAGTPNIAGAIGLGRAVQYLDEIGMKTIESYEQELSQYSLQTLQSIPGLTLHGPQNTKDRGAIFSFSLENIHPHDLATILGEQNICVRAGNHCAQPLMEYLHVPATTRISLYFYNNKEDIDRCKEGILSAQKVFKN